ncbi:Hint domain-containing protein [Methylorubrum extorquens]|uniref:Hint domain-containing protein n=1 Tax=Methylorubrum extorquens TaxID=408 RepID=UPI0022384F56|nr:Hint domain-containing protein [Methylorubrum extorquens]UYW34280.1 Hint domain-containing protein [Methylorubrum extorquens]
MSNFLDAPNTVFEAGRFGALGRISYQYDFADVSISAGGIQYNIKSKGTNPDPIGGFGETVVGSDGSNRTISGRSTVFNINLLCFASGTRIKTVAGNVHVEDLESGDLVVTASDQVRPIIWIGHRHLCVAAPELAPIRIRAGAFGNCLPERDLFLSPGHPMLVGADADNDGGVLVPVMCLINGTTITREPVANVTYWHVELYAHDILLAEGLPAESYIDGGDRAFFEQASDIALHNPDFVTPNWSCRCRPVAVDGPIVLAERVRLDAVFASSLAAQCDWNLSAQSLSTAPMWGADTLLDSPRSAGDAS